MYESDFRKIVFDLEPLSKFFLPYTLGGYNLYENVRNKKVSNSLLPNCTGGAFGLAMQMLGTKNYKEVGLPKNHAKYWYSQANKTLWKQSKFPTLGAIACWSNSGNGHVGMCVDLERDSNNNVIGTPTILESSYYSYNNKNWRKGKTYAYNTKTGVLTKNNYKFLGWLVPVCMELDPVVPKLKKGDKVEILKAGNARKDGKGKVSKGIGWKRYILKVHEGEPYPYQVGNLLRITTGYYTEDALKKV